MAVEDQDDLLTVGLADQPMRKSMSTAAVKRCLKTLNCRRPLLEIAEITFAPKRWPVPATIGVCPTGDQERPARVIGAQAHLVGPQDQRLLAVGARLDRGIALLQPLADRAGSCSNARRAGFCGLNPQTRR